MNRVLAVAKLLALCSVTVAFVFLALLFREARSVVGHINAAVDQTSSTAAHVDAEFGHTLKHADAVLLQTSETMNQVRHVAMDERKFAKEANDRTLAVLDHTNQVLADLDRNQARLSDSAVATLDATTSAVLQSKADLDTINGALLDNRKQLADAVTQLNGIASDVHSMTSDAKAAVHRYTAPPTRKQRILSNAKDAGGLTYMATKILLMLGLI